MSFLRFGLFFVLVVFVGGASSLFGARVVCVEKVLEQVGKRGEFGPFWVGRPLARGDWKVSVSDLKERAGREIAAVTGLDAAALSVPRIYFQEWFVHPPQADAAPVRTHGEVLARMAKTDSVSMRRSAFLAVVDPPKGYPFSLAFALRLNGTTGVFPVARHDDRFTQLGPPLRERPTTLIIGLPKRAGAANVKALEAAVSALPQTTVALYNQGFDSREISGNLVVKSPRLASTIEAARLAKQLLPSSTPDYWFGGRGPFSSQYGPLIDVSGREQVWPDELAVLEKTLIEQGFVFDGPFCVARPYGPGTPTALLVNGARRNLAAILATLPPDFQLVSVYHEAARTPPPKRIAQGKSPGFEQWLIDRDYVQVRRRHEPIWTFLGYWEHRPEEPVNVPGLVDVFTGDLIPPEWEP